jgi:hypothetical protein
MRGRRVFSLLAVVFGLALLPATAFAHDHDRDWKGHHRSWRDGDHDRDNHYREHHGYDRYYNYHRNHWRGRCVDPDHDGDCDFVRPRYYRNYWGRGECVDPDHDGDCDFIRHRHRRYYQNGWYQNGWYGNSYYSNPAIWGNYPYAGSLNTWQNGRWGNGSVPPGWRNGKHKGWYKHHKHDRDEDDD